MDTTESYDNLFLEWGVPPVLQVKARQDNAKLVRAFHKKTLLNHVTHTFTLPAHTPTTVSLELDVDFRNRWQHACVVQLGLDYWYEKDGETRFVVCAEKESAIVTEKSHVKIVANVPPFSEPTTISIGIRAVGQLQTALPVWNPRTLELIQGNKVALIKLLKGALASVQQGAVSLHPSFAKELAR